MKRFLRAIRWTPNKYDGRTIGQLAYLNYDESVQFAAAFTIPASTLAICAHDHGFDYSMNTTCPKCGSSSWLRISDLGVYPVNSDAFVSTVAVGKRESAVA